MEWISVDDRLPVVVREYRSFSETVWCFYDKAKPGLMARGFYDHDEDAWYCNEPNAPDFPIVVTHWMPLPEPPKEK